jgi:membrane protease YdiL (CAAX protease family)
MESGSSKRPIDQQPGETWFVKHPWVSLASFLILSVLLLGLLGTLYTQVLGMSADSGTTGFLTSLSSHLLLLFIITPFLLRLPLGHTSFKGYLDDIGLAKVEPAGRLLLIALSCYLILALSQAVGSVVYRLFQALPVTWVFIGSVFDITGDLPPQSMSVVYSLPSALEEVGSRGIILTLFLAHYSKRSSILISATGFAALHLLNLLGGREPVWVLGQLIWSFLMGVFYGYLYVRTRSLLPPMLVHYLGNVFVGSFAGYMQSHAAVEVQTIYGIIFTFGVVPVTLMMLWVKYVTYKWPVERF